MFFSKTSTLSVVAAVTSLVAAQTSTMMSGSTATMSSTPSGSVLVHVINAKTDSASGKPVFDPPQVMANVGDLVQFHFWPMNHSVVQAAFADPCVPISESAAGNGTVGFYSGFMPVMANAAEMPTFTIEVNNTKPIWFYCSQGHHCQAGMVGAINPTAEKTLTDFMGRAAQAAANLSPGQVSGGSSGEATGTAAVLPSTMATMSGSSTASAASTSAPAGTNAAPGSAAYFSSAVAIAFAIVASSVLLL